MVKGFLMQRFFLITIVAINVSGCRQSAQEKEFYDTLDAFMREARTFLHFQSSNEGAAKNHAERNDLKVERAFAAIPENWQGRLGRTYRKAIEVRGHIQKSAKAQGEMVIGPSLDRVLATSGFDGWQKARLRNGELVGEVGIYKRLADKTLTELASMAD